ncbi:MAG: hypothetical protein ACKO2P_11060 [Planctomycetota bacterium]
MKKKHQVNLRMLDETALVGLDVLEIWDGADLIVLREALSSLVQLEGRLSVGVDMASVMHIPSGFFGMLFEWYESGVEVLLYAPRVHVQQMLWFRMYFREDARRSGVYRLTDADVRHHTPLEQEAYHRREFSGVLTGDSFDLLQTDSDADADADAEF